MAGLGFTVSATEATCPTSAYTLLQIQAPTNQKVIVKEWSFSIASTTPVLVRVVRQSNRPSGSSAANPVKENDKDSETVQTTGRQTFAGSFQPTDTDELFGEEVQGGYTWQAPYKEEIIVGGGEYLAIELNSSVAAKVKARFKCSE